MRDMNEVFSSVAEKYGVTQEEVKKTIEETVREGLQSSDINVRYLFSQIPKKGEEATAEEILTHFAVIVARTKGLW